jgi:hypothetical protein
MSRHCAAAAAVACRFAAPFEAASRSKPAANNGADPNSSVRCVPYGTVIE